MSVLFVDYEKPTNVWVEQQETIITRGVFIKGIQIHTDASIETITSSPSLPSGLYIDPVRGVITGIYQDLYVGKSCYTIRASNRYGVTFSDVCFIFTSICAQFVLIPRFIY